MKLWGYIDSAADRVAKWAMYLSVFCIAYIVISATADIIATKFFSHPIPATSELIEDMNIPMVYMGMAYVQLTKGHIAGPVFDKQFSATVNKGINITSCVLGMIVCGLIAWQAIPLLQEMISTHQTRVGQAEYVLWPFGLSIFIGFALVTLSFCLSIVRILMKPGKPGNGEVEEELPMF